MKAVVYKSDLHPSYLNMKFDKEKSSEKAFTKLKGPLEEIAEVVG